MAGKVAKEVNIKITGSNEVRAAIDAAERDLKLMTQADWAGVKRKQQEEATWRRDQDQAWQARQRKQREAEAEAMQEEAAWRKERDREWAEKQKGGGGIAAASMLKFGVSLLAVEKVDQILKRSAAGLKDWAEGTKTAGQAISSALDAIPIIGAIDDIGSALFALRSQYEKTASVASQMAARNIRDNKQILASRKELLEQELKAAEESRKRSAIFGPTPPPEKAAVADIRQQIEEAVKARMEWLKTRAVAANGSGELALESDQFELDRMDRRIIELRQGLRTQLVVESKKTLTAKIINFIPDLIDEALAATQRDVRQAIASEQKGRGRKVVEELFGGKVWDAAPKMLEGMTNARDPNFTAAMEAAKRARMGIQEAAEDVTEFFGGFFGIDGKKGGKSAKPTPKERQEIRDSFDADYSPYLTGVRSQGSDPAAEAQRQIQKNTEQANAIAQVGNRLIETLVSLVRSGTGGGNVIKSLN